MEPMPSIHHSAPPRGLRIPGFDNRIVSLRAHERRPPKAGDPALPLLAAPAVLRFVGGSIAGGEGPGTVGSVPNGMLAARHLLLAEDEVLVSLELSMVLEDAGADVVPTYSLDDTLDAARNGRFDAAVLDVNLAGCEVFPAARLLAERDVPIVFHTGHAKADDIAVDYPRALTLAKPIAPERVVGAVAGIIGGTN